MKMFKVSWIRSLPGFLLATISLLGSERFDPYTSSENGVTFVREFRLENRAWLGPVHFRNTDYEKLEIEGYSTSGNELEVLQMPESLSAGEAGKAVVLFTPRSTGFHSASVLLTTNRGNLRLHLRIRVTAENEWVPLALNWQEMDRFGQKPDRFEVGSAELYTDILENPVDLNRLLIDPRLGRNHQKGHAEDSIQIPLHQLVHRSEWKDKEIYVLDEGLQSVIVLNELLRLRKAGFESLYWVKGGLNAWESLDAPISAYSGASSSWRAIAPVHLQNSLLRDEMVVVVIGDESDFIAGRTLFGGQPVYHWEVDERETVTLNRISDRFESNQPFLLLSSSGMGYENVLGQLQQAGFYHIYLLDKGISGLAAYLEAQGRPRSRKFQVVRAGAGNPKGKEPPRRLTDSDCANCP